MKKELDEALVRDFPNLYCKRHERGTSMYYGFPGDGWEPALRQLSAKLEKMILALPEKHRVDCYAAQVKEKFGGLRVNMDYPRESMSSGDLELREAVAEMQKAVSETEALCWKICESCGEEGTLRRGGWLRTQCDVCHATAQNKRKAGKDRWNA